MFNKTEQIDNQVNDKLKQLLEYENIPHNNLYQAMQYSLIDSGKRLRPFLTITFCQIFNINLEYALRVAAAIEMIHCYSLIHDDLPSMDNDDYRRGKLTCHKQFNEATAILAGDALLTYAFEVLSQIETHPNANIRCHLITRIAQAAGKDGMIGGQILDINTEYNNELDSLLLLHKMKTGDLFAISCETAAILAEKPEYIQLKLREFGYFIGKAYQIIDDFEDYLQKQEISNIINIIGNQAAKNLINDTLNKAEQILNDIDCSDAIIIDFINFLKDKVTDGYYALNQ